MPLRPSQLDSMFFSVWVAKKASTQPVSRVAGLPSPQLSSGPLYVVLFDAFWHCRVVEAGSRRKNGLPDCCVFSVTGFGPLYAELPVPASTCSLLPSTLPLAASTYTVCLESSSPLAPATWVAQASRGVPRAYTTSVGVPVELTFESLVRDVCCAFAAATVALMPRLPIDDVWATEVARKLPWASVTTTKSPPMTGRRLYVRSYGTYCRPSGTEMTGLATNASLLPALRAAGRVATS